MQVQPQKTLSVFDSVCIIVGIIIGAGIYETAPTVAAAMGSAPAMLGIWLLGGVLALFGSLCYGELATAYPLAGGDVVYLGRAYGKWAGFLFGWSQMMIIRPGDIALMAFIFARYADRIFAFRASASVYAVAVIVLLTALNILGVRQGKWTQNLLTTVKAAGLLAIGIAALFAPAQQPEAPAQGPPTAIPLALILVLFTYGGWNEIGYVAAEVKHPARNIIRALVLGVAAVTGLYLLVNAAFVRVLGYEAMAASEAVAADTLEAVLPRAAGRIIAAMVCVSSLGAVNGLIFTGARISYAVGTGHRAFGNLGRWSPHFGTPVRALVLQGLLSCAIVLLAGSFINTLLYTAPLVWLFFLGTGCAVFVLRKKDPRHDRPYKVAAYPFVPLVFCATCVFMLYSCITFALQNRPAGFAVMGTLLATGAVIYVLKLRTED